MGKLSTHTTEVNTVSVALGLLLAFRVNTAYDRYWEGRKLIQAIISIIRSFARQIWTHAPEETENDCLQKKYCINLVLAFFIATIHHLRQEKGAHHKDLRELLPPGWIPSCVKKSEGDALSTKSSLNLPLNLEGEPSNCRARRASDGSLDAYEDNSEALRYTEDVHSRLPRDILEEPDDNRITEVSEDMCMEADNPTDINNISRSLVFQEFQITNIDKLTVKELEKFVRDLERRVRVQDEEARHERQPLLHQTKSQADLPVYSHVSHNKRKVLYREALKLVKKYEDQKRQPKTRPTEHCQFKCSEDLPYLGDSEISLPIEILFHVTFYIKKLKAQEKNKSALLSSATSSTDALVNSLTALERIAQTPIPKAYNIHLKQAVTLYIFFLPLALVESLGWLVTPVVALASFTLFGILAIGEEIENPFGYDDNDLPLLDYYAGLKKDVDYILRRIPHRDTLFHGI
ncbi:hypothetical protein G6F17_003695 [Rhizopus arrhizus]|nr:hypothetical protein G6F17_003695 [Rhizopus arrhizus]